MSIRFNPEDWARIRQSHGAWWRGELDRPLVHVQAKLHPLPEHSMPRAPLLSQASCADFSISPEALIDRLDAELSQYEFWGDAYPMVNFNSFGPGVAAAFCGAKLDNSNGSVWFFPAEKKPIEEISIRYDPESIWVKRIKAIYRAGGEKWQGNVLLSIPDLGGVMDIVATFVGTENLLMALYDAPDEVKRLTNEAHTAFMDAYCDLSRTLAEIKNPGFSNWDGLYSETPSYVTQSDFSYMVGPDMFREFIFDDLQLSCRELDNVIYHMDGIGQLPHLPHLLSMENLKAIQWVPGEGQRQGAYWMDVFRQIIASGRGCEVTGGPGAFLEVLGELSHGLYHQTGFHDAETARRFLSRCGMNEKGARL